MAKSTAALSTELLRSSDDPLYRRLRELLPELGIDVGRDVLADLFPDDGNQEFGVVVTRDHRVFTFVFHYGRGDLSAQTATGFLADWKDLSPWWASSPYADRVRDALSTVGNHLAPGRSTRRKYSTAQMDRSSTAVLEPGCP